jgi:probable HAF family extracellular repeat protein
VCGSKNTKRKGDDMKSRLLLTQSLPGLLILLTMSAGITTPAQAQNPPRYTVTDLGPVGPPPGQPFVISGNGLVSGEVVLANPANPAESVSHAVLWIRNKMTDISTPGLGGPNSAAFGVNIWGQAVGQADTEVPDPNGEDFCGSAALSLTHSGNTCEPFIWQHGVMTPLPRLRNSDGAQGNNGLAFQINDFGAAVGTAEDALLDSTCPGPPTSPQTIEFKPVIWSQPFPWAKPAIRELQTFSGDPDGVALAINNLGQIVGSSGTCGMFNSIELFNLLPLHALLWENGTVIDLGSLGGDGKFAGIYATGLNNSGQVVGVSDTTGDASFHGFLWQKGHITDLGTLPGDAFSVTTSIGDNGMVLGASIDASFTPRAVLWRNGTPTDLNTLVPASSTLALQTACSITAKGEIIGFAVVKGTTTDYHAYLATPVASSADID